MRATRAGLALWAVVVLSLAATPSHGIVLANMDRAAVPGNNFYAFANGAWIRQAKIPPDQASVGPFDAMLQVSDQHTVDIIRTMAASHPAAGTPEAKVADVYNAYLDTAAIEKRGLGPLQAPLSMIAAIKTRSDLSRALGATVRADVDALNDTNYWTPNIFGLWVVSGFHDTAHYHPYLLQGGTEMQSRDYYLGPAAKMAGIRQAYVAHIAAMLRLAGLSDTAARAARVMNLETAIARAQESLEASEDVGKADNDWTPASFAQRAPGMDWAAFFAAAGLNNAPSLDVWQPAAVTAEAQLVGSEPLAAWQDWLSYHLVEDYAMVLPQALREEHFAFFGKVIAGTPAPPPRWRLAVAVVNRELGDVVGRRYVALYFPASAKAEAQAMVQGLVTAFEKQLAGLQWMAPGTKAEAEKKLQQIYVGVGYPESWRGYSGLNVSPDDAFANLWQARLYEYHRNLARLGKPVNRHEWHMEPQTVNAVNLPLQDALNFPAAILQPPFFDPQAPPAVNYGAIGAVIGHEISHTFDTEGSLFDAAGALRNWWTPADFAHFKTVTQRLAAQYSSYEALPGLHVNGEQTLGEDIADDAGLADALAAYQAKYGTGGTAAGGFTPGQQFFIAFGQIWAEKDRPEALRQQVLTDPHAPGEFRADTVRNQDAWYADFGVKPGQALYLAPAQRAQIW